MGEKHTPGPWTLDSDGDVVAHGLDIALVWVNSGGSCAANAHLIAAAPQLKYACAAAEDFIATIDSDAARAIYDQLHAALQAATPTDTKPAGEGV